MADRVKVSVVVSTYNRSDALAAVLVGLARQQGVSPAEWEIVVADDGSRPDTAEVVARLAPHCRCRVVHVWHADEGFRLAAIRNLAAQAASGDWLVFLDGDCLPFPDFVVRQRSLAEAGWFVAGNRILLDEASTRTICDDPPGAPRIVESPWWRWPARRAAGHCNVWLPTLRLPLGPLRKLRARRWQVLKGCNIGVWMGDFAAVDGFDESYSGWGREDSDLAIRLIRAGLRLKDGRFAAPVLHLWHRENDRSQLGDNDRRLAGILASDRTRAALGFASHATAEIAAAQRAVYEAAA